MEIKLIDQKISVGEVKEIAASRFGDLVKAVVDLNKDVMAIGGELHADEEKQLLDQGSEQKNLWGINLYPEKYGSEEFVEFDSMINIRPSQNNRSRSVEDSEIRKKIIELVGRLVHE